MVCSEAANLFQVGGWSGLLLNDMQNTQNTLQADEMISYQFGTSNTECQQSPLTQTSRLIVTGQLAGVVAGTTLAEFITDS
jgi:hypothetical protein